MPEKLEQLRAELTTALERQQPDFGRILTLSSQLAALDPKNVRFTADAGLISRLGLQLVARQETAVSELVKNAYDADANEVRLIFSRSDKPGGRLLVEDDGNGMTRDQLMNGFMRLASPDKVNNPVSPRLKRQRAGRKGIGRFAAQRLGTDLTLITQTESSPTALTLRIDWSKFDNEQDLFAIANKVELSPKQKSRGTLLIIDGLREPWSESQIARVYRYVEALLQPSLEPVATKRIPKKAQFKATFSILRGVKETPVASEETMVYSHAVATVTGRVDAKGYGFWSVESKRLALDEEVQFKASDTKAKIRFSELPDITFAAKYFIWSPELVPAQELPRLRQLAEKWGGIRLYRNGFRVLPYGEQNNDWLGLDEEYRRRGILVPLGNNNWFGFVEVHDQTGEKFDETSSREGLADNAAFRQLVRFVSDSLKGAALRVASARGKKGRASQRNYRKKARGTPADEIAKIAQELEKLTVSLGKGETRAIGKTDTTNVLGRVLDQLRVTALETKEQLEENDMLRVLGSLGLTIGIFTHEVRLRLVDLRDDLQTLLEQRSLTAAARQALASMNSHFEIIQSYTAYFDATISANVTRERSSKEVGWILHDFIRHFQPVATRDHILFADLDIEPALFTVPIHVSEWASILTNLFTNARKAILRAATSTNRRISIRASCDDDRLLIDFADTGDGIPPEHVERIFDPFFTTTHSAAAEGDGNLTGTGLGLKIVRDIVSAAGGEIYVASPPSGYATCMRIELPAKDEPLNT